MAKSRAILREVNAYALLSPGQREELRMNPRDSVRTPRPVPTARPRLTLGLDGSVLIRDEAFPDRKAKPFDVDGVVISMRLDPVGSTLPAPISPADAHLGVLATKGTAALPIPPGSKGRTLWAMAQYYNERGELGPVGDVVSVTIAA